MTGSTFPWGCPRCHTALEQVSPTEKRCPTDHLHFHQENGIWYFILPERYDKFKQFIHEYTTVRKAEGRGSVDPAYYQELPYKDLSGRFTGDWEIRTKSFDALISQVIEPVERFSSLPLKILDLGAGNGWLSHRLALRGHQAGAVDIMTDPFDGLGAHIHYATDFTPVNAEFDCLPFTPDQFDLVIFNSSLHYSENYKITLIEALRVLEPEGTLVILDTPIYHDPLSGEQMVREREREYEKRYGFPSNALNSQNFLTFNQLNKLESETGLKWQLIYPKYGLRRQLRPWIARLRRIREPAKFLLVIGRRFKQPVKCV